MLEVDLSQYAAGVLSRQELDRRLRDLVAAAPEAVGMLPGLLRDAKVNGLLTELDCADLIAALPTGTVVDPSGAQTRFRSPMTRSLAAIERPSDATDGTLQIGRVLNGKYRLERELGSGGMGVVFLAEDLIGTEPVAIKMLRSDLRTDPDIMRALREEMTQTRKLRHENIVGVYALEQDGTHPYIVMEYLIGKTLRAVLDEDCVRGLPWARAWPLIAGIGAALAFAHDRGIIHSDLKPDNIFLAAAGVPKVLDFGIARAMRTPADGAGTGAPHSYTPSYASCELIEGAPPDFSDDVYSFACLIYEVLTGRQPFDRVEAPQARDEARVPSVIPILSAAQNTHLRRGLAFRRADRIASIEELLKGLEKPSTESKSGPVAAMIAAALLVGIGAWWGLRTLLVSRASPAAIAARHETQSDAPDSATSLPSASTPSTRRSGDLFKDCSTICPQMIVIPAGAFRMGSPADEPGRRTDEDLRPISFAHAFALSIYPVSKAEFRSFLTDTQYRRTAACDNLANPEERTPVSFEEPGYVQTDNDPAVCVSVQDARAYAAWINRELGAQVYRLPSEAEWEYAARAGTEAGTPWLSRDSQACRSGNFGDRSYEQRIGPPMRSSSLCDDGFAATSPVGSFPKNVWGLFDMIGNVFEWTESCGQQLDATNGDAFLTNCQKYRVVRGAAFSTTLAGNYVRFARRVIPPPATQAANIWGFRLARSL